MPQPKCIANRDKVKWKLENGRKRLKKITDNYVFRVNDYYFNLINWNDPDDPMKKLAIPNEGELLEDSELLGKIREFSTPDNRIYVMVHIHHPREITPEAKRWFQSLHDAGAIVVNQTPILRGINDDPVILGDLLDCLSWAGVVPYGFFVNRPVAGNHEFELPLKKVYRIVEEAKARTSGLGKNIRLSMSHISGNIEILAIEDGKAYLKYHQSREDLNGKLMILDCPDDALWFDDLPGSGTIWSKPKEKTDNAVSAADLPYGPLKGYVIGD